MFVDLIIRTERKMSIEISIILDLFKNKMYNKEKR